MKEKKSIFKKFEAKDYVFFGYLFSIGFNVLFIGMFFTAFFHESKQVIVDINYFGEALVEAVLFPIIFGIVILGFFTFKRMHYGKIRFSFKRKVPGQYTIYALFMTALTLIAYIVVYPVLMDIIEQSNISGVEGLIVAWFPLFILLFVLWSAIWYVQPRQPR